MRFLLLAWRNTLRNPRRTALTITAIALGVAALVMAWALFDGGNAQMVENMTASYSGYVQIHRHGYEDDPTTLDLVFRHSEVKEALSHSPHVVAMTERLENRVLISTETYARGIILAGVDPEQEKGVTNIHQKMVEGRYLNREDRRGIMLGSGLARTLGVKVGGEIALVGQGMYGSIGADRFRVEGIYDTGNEMADNLQAFITLPEADELFGADGQLTSIALKLDHRDAAQSVKEALVREIGSKLEVLSWQELLPSVSQSISFHDGVATVVMIFLFCIVALGVTNTILMSVSERRREFGVMLSLGTTPGRLFVSIIYEGLFIGLIGFAAGTIVGTAIVAHFAHNGIHFNDASGMVRVMQGGDGAIYPTLSWGRVIMMAAAMILVSLVASLYPAFKVARLRPLQAMQGTAADQKDVGANAGQGKSSRSILLQMALRNLWRQPVRTRLTMGAITFGLGAFIFLCSVAIGYFTQTIENATGTISGDAQVLRPAFKTDNQVGASLAFPAEGLVEKVASMPGVQAVSPRAQTQAMIGVANRSEAIMLVGVSPELEPKVTFMDKAVHLGRYLSPDGAREIVIGVKLATLLRVELGDKVVVTAQDRNGKLVSDAFVVTGIFDTASQGHGADRLIAFINLPSAQRLLGLGSDYTNLALRFSARDDEVVFAGVERINAALSGSPVVAMPWHELMPEVVQMRAMIVRSLVFVLTVVFVMVSVVVANTILMAVLERTREFGIMLALGSSPRLLVRLVVLESGLLGLFATGMGIALGVGLALLHLAKGVNLKSHGLTAVPGVTNVIYPKLTELGVFGPALVVLVVIILAACYPAMRAARLVPVQAIRHA